MKKTFLLAAFPLLLFATDNNDLKIIELQEKVNYLLQLSKVHQESIDENIDILERVERKSILDKVNFSPEFLLRFDKLGYKNRSIEGENTTVDGNPASEQRRDEFHKRFQVASSIRFRLNMNAKFKDIKFYGRMLYMTSSQSNERLCILSRDIKNGTASSAFDVDRAYVDYTLNSKSSTPLTFSFGLLPTTAGTPMQYAQNKKRNALFPALVFNMNTYGMLATQKFSQNTYARVVLAKAYTLRANFYPYQCNRENIDNANIIGLYADTKFNFYGKALASFGVNILNDFRAHPYLGPDVSADNSHNLGTIATFGLGIDIEKFANSDTTFFIHTALSNPHANGNTDDYKITQYVDGEGLTADENAGFTEADYASGTLLSQNGYSVFLGTKYDINTAFNLGLEFNYGSKYWFSATQGAEDTFNKLAIRGTAFEVYGTWKFHKYLNTKLGYMRIDENYTGSGWHFGEPAKKDATQNILSLSIEARF
ncbi:DUF3373 family protein [Sulfurimonas sp.]|uniref:DUF3373 family protein n=1 Tax=Sulfurimonas sp. TaxID=2022749 RepID=UPI0026332903|nr:DUF3373 family protein [Sulfurimonas sp.]